MKPKRGWEEHQKIFNLLRAIGRRGGNTREVLERTEGSWATYHPLLFRLEALGLVKSKRRTVGNVQRVRWRLTDLGWTLYSHYNKAAIYLAKAENLLREVER
jgi:DNA-binding IclR family transcriptional regulator